MTLTLGIGASELPWGKTGAVTPADVTHICQDAKAIGASSIRMSAAWGLVDPNNNGKYQWTDLDTAMDAAEAAGLDVLLILEPRRLSFFAVLGVPVAVTDTASNVKNYGKFCGAVAQRYADRSITAFSVGNEVNNKANMVSPKDPSKYVDFLRAAHDNIVTYIPGATILAGDLQAVLTDIYLTQATLHPVDWVTKFYACNPQDCFNGLAIHPYSTDGKFHPVTPTPDNEFAFKNIEKIRAVMDANGDGPSGRDIKIWLTEWGYDAVRSLTGLSTTTEQLEAEQALNVQTHFNLLKTYEALGYVHDITWNYNTHDHQSNSDPAYSYGATRNDYTRRPSFYTLQGLIGGKTLDVPTIGASTVVEVPDVDVYVDTSHPFVPPITAAAAVPAAGVTSPLSPPTIGATAEALVPVVDVVTLDVEWVSTGAGDADTTTGLEIILTWDHVVAATSHGALSTELVVSTDHLKDWSLYNTLTVNSSIDGDLKRLASRHVSASTTKKGSLHIFGLADTGNNALPPTAGTHHMTAHVKLNNDFVTSLTEVLGNSLLHQGVAKFGTVTNTGSAAGGNTPSITSPSAVGDRVIVVIGSSQDKHSSFTQMLLWNAGTTVTGDGDFAIIGDMAGAVPSVTAACTGATQYGALTVDLVKA